MNFSRRLLQPGPFKLKYFKVLKLPAIYFLIGQFMMSEMCDWWGKIEVQKLPKKRIRWQIQKLDIKESTNWFYTLFTYDWVKAYLIVALDLKYKHAFESCLGLLIKAFFAGRQYFWNFQGHTSYWTGGCTLPNAHAQHSKLLSCRRVDSKLTSIKTAKFRRYCLP